MVTCGPVYFPRGWILGIVPLKALELGTEAVYIHRVSVLGFSAGKESVRNATTSLIAWPLLGLDPVNLPERWIYWMIFREECLETSPSERAAGASFAQEHSLRFDSRKSK